ncbi:DUF1850 domain-containing protein [Rhodobacterales bacterium HKCCE3408]|nr:DUF1850 domain-containing protein [Rhodobacterales bacterium HKCCE3408]
MTARTGGGLAALLLFSGLTAASAADLVATREDGTVIARLPVPEGAGWCVLWHHSVQGFEVSDCYENRDGRMVLVRSRQPDFAAGLGHIPGRGRQVSDGEGGYWILDIDEPVPGNAYVLRPGVGFVDHRLQVGDTVVSLSAAAPHERVRIELMGDED